MTDHGQRTVREEILRCGRDARRLREREAASPAGPLSGPGPDVPERRDGAAGHVRPGGGRAAQHSGRASGGRG